MKIEDLNSTAHTARIRAQEHIIRELIKYGHDQEQSEVINFLMHLTMTMSAVRKIVNNN